jgi:hypothetical protein
MKDNVWFVPLDSERSESAYEAHPEAKRIENAQAFTAELGTVMVAEDLEGYLRGGNDVLVTTPTSLGDQPKVQRVHNYEEDLPQGQTLKHFLASTAHVCDFYSGSDRLWLELAIREIDTDAGERAALLSAFTNLAATAGAVFPQALPYAAAASGLAGVLGKLFSALERDEAAIHYATALYGSDRPNDPPLQTGRYVVFANPVDGAADVSYAVFSVDAVKTVTPSYLVAQRGATLLTQLDRGNPNTPQVSVEFLNDTLNQYSNLKDLGRFRQLSFRDPAMWTQAEKDWVDGLYTRNDLVPFLPARGAPQPAPA